MQAVITRNGQVYRVQRDGPTQGQQAAEAQMQELQAQMEAATARITELVTSGADRTAPGRQELSEARADLAATAAQMRDVAVLMRRDAVAEAGRAVAGDGFVFQGPGRATTGVPPRRPDDIPDIPQGVQDVSMLFIVCAAGAIILTPLMRAVGRIIERRAAPPQRLTPEIEGQLTRMEQAIETVAVELERVSEGQRYTTRLLSEREKVASLRS